MSDEFPFDVYQETDLVKVIATCSEAIFYSLQELVSKVSELIDVVENKSL